jgi:hypothetical protein
MLDNADMILDLSAYPTVRMRFLVFGKVDEKFWEVKFDCAGTLKLSILNDFDIGPNDFHVVLGASVQSINVADCAEEVRCRVPDNLGGEAIWTVAVEGHLAAVLSCTDFVWSVQELDPQAYEQRYA